MTEFAAIEEFLDYEVHDDGRIYSHLSKRFLPIRVNHQGIRNINLHRGGVDYCRSVAVLVAKAFVDPPDRRSNTVIHLDGDRGNLQANNLAWRPRPFAIEYHKQFQNQPYQNRMYEPLIIHETGEEFPDSWELAKTYGLLERAVVLSAANILHGHWNYTVYPTDHHILIKRHIK